MIFDCEMRLWLMKKEEKLGRQEQILEQKLRLIDPTLTTRYLTRALLALMQHLLILSASCTSCSIH
jgi:hypothetical protein